MTEDEETRLIAIVAEYLSVRETAQIWFDLGAAELASAADKLTQMFADLYADMDEEFWRIAAEYDDGWDILREATGDR